MFFDGGEEGEKKKKQEETGIYIYIIFNALGIFFLCIGKFIGFGMIIRGFLNF